MKRKHKYQHKDVARRWEGNPVITLNDLPFRCSDICNAAAVKFNGEFLLLLTIEHLVGRKSLHLAKSLDGYHFSVEAEPLIAPSERPAFKSYEEQGVLDPKIVFLEGTFYISYTAASASGFRLALARTEDFTSVERLGFISEPDSKGGLLFPEKINGRYAKLEMPADGSSIWISYSDDLAYWGGFDVVMSPREGFWDFHKIGPAAPPFRMDDGKWLLLYYGVKRTSAGGLSRLGAAFLDGDDPSKVVSRTNIPILAPRKNYERVGDSPNTIFTCGAILEKEQLTVYYGASKGCVCIGSCSVNDIIDNCVASEKEF
ncbi:MAG: glycosidase [Kiritimatiellaeota bacterium]|nr:glycosidase [Kiritimatiellota bacterium]